MDKNLSKWIGISIIVALNIILISALLIFIYPLALLIFAPSDQPLFSPPDTPVMYTLPTSAKILQQDSTAADFFGDYAFCVSFMLTDSGIDKLIKERFDWFTSDGRKLPTTMEDWQNGQLPKEVFELAEGFGACKRQVPNKSTTYKYLHKRVEGGQERLLVIDEKQNIIYYYRGSW